MIGIFGMLPNYRIRVLSIIKDLVHIESYQFLAAFSSSPRYLITLICILYFGTLVFYAYDSRHFTIYTWYLITP